MNHYELEFLAPGFGREEVNTFLQRYLTSNRDEEARVKVMNDWGSDYLLRKKDGKLEMVGGGVKLLSGSVTKKSERFYFSFMGGGLSRNELDYAGNFPTHSWLEEAGGDGFRSFYVFNHFVGDNYRDFVEELKRFSSELRIPVREL